jgi:hypothetical protein
LQSCPERTLHRDVRFVPKADIAANLVQDPFCRAG